jgi:hypothetical protein
MLLKILGISVLLGVFIKFMLISFVKELFSFIDLKKKGVPTEGVIVDVIESKDSDNLTVYQKVVEFTTLDNRKCRYISESNMYKPNLRKKVKLIYDPHDVDHVIINTKGEFIWILFKNLFVIIVFVFLLYGFVFATEG